MRCLGFKIFREKYIDKVFFDNFTGLRYLLGEKSEITVFDVGANVGQSVEAYRRKFPNATIHSFEPNPEAFDQLRRRVGASRDVHLNNFALGDKKEETVLSIPPNSADASLHRFNPTSVTLANNVYPREHYRPERVKQVEVSVDTLDHYCEQHGIGVIDILKIDVQGYEKQVLRGSSTMLAGGRIKIILTEIMFDDVYTETSSFFEVEQLIRPFLFSLYDISHIYKDLKRGRTHWVDAIYTRLPGRGGDGAT